MDEITTWFEEEFRHLGFTVTPLMYDPETFTPVRGILWRRPDGAYLRTNIGLKPEIVDDLRGDYLDTLTSYKELIREHINTFLEENTSKDFKPKKKINKIKL